LITRSAALQAVQEYDRANKLLLKDVKKQQSTVLFSVPPPRSKGFNRIQVVPNRVTVGEGLEEINCLARRT
jgi:hypothetical protein